MANSKKKIDKKAFGSNFKTAQAGPGYRPRPGSDAGGHTGRMGEPIKWPPPPVKRV
jgi:hypothetical protein